MKFDEWFTKQIGPRPEGDLDELHRTVEAGERARDRIRAINEWARVRNAALYAWQLPGGYKASTCGNGQ